VKLEGESTMLRVVGTLEECLEDAQKQAKALELEFGGINPQNPVVWASGHFEAQRSTTLSIPRKGGNEIQTGQGQIVVTQLLPNIWAVAELIDATHPLDAVWDLYMEKLERQTTQACRIPINSSVRELVEKFYDRTRWKDLADPWYSRFLERYPHAEAVWQKICGNPEASPLFNVWNDGVASLHFKVTGHEFYSTTEFDSINVSW